MLRDAKTARHRQCNMVEPTKFILSCLIFLGLATPVLGQQISANDPNIIYTRDDSCGDYCTSNTVSHWVFDGYNEYSNVAEDPYPGTQVYGASAIINFSGTGITWIGSQGPNFGWAAYSVDGGPVQWIDNYSPTEIDGTEIAVITGLSPGSHALKIEVTPWTDGSDHYQLISGFNIENGTTIAPSQTLGSLDMLPGGYLIPSDGWYCGNDAGPNNASDLSWSHCWQTVPAGTGSLLSWNFNGSLVEIFGRPDAEDGFADIYIDDNPITQTDWVYSTVDNDLMSAYPMFVWSGPPGDHSITLVATGTTDSFVDDRALTQIDELMVFP